LNITHQLAAAQTVDQVITLANRFISELPPEALDRFPARCRPDAIADSAAVHYWRRQLLAEVCTLPSTPDLRLQELAVFFLRASSRVHALATAPEPAAATTAPIESAPA
jgi:hypothetical protein